MDDLSIIELYRLRDELAIEESEKKYGVYCKTVAKNILCDPRDTEEAVNETWLRAWKSIPPAVPKVLSAFLGGITRNISLNVLRSNTAKKRSDSFTESYTELEGIVGAGDVEAEIEAKELEKFISDFIDGLPDIQRRVFLCRYWYFDSIEDIAYKFGYSKGKVKSMLFRIRNRLKEQLDKEELL